MYGFRPLPIMEVPTSGSSCSPLVSIATFSVMLGGCGEYTEVGRWGSKLRPVVTLGGVWTHPKLLNRWTLAGAGWSAARAGSLALRVTPALGLYPGYSARLLQGGPGRPPIRSRLCAAVGGVPLPLADAYLARSMYCWAGVRPGRDDTPFSGGDPGGKGEAREERRLTV